MKLRVCITIVMITILLFGVAKVAFAQDIVAGVAPGNEFTYTVTGTYPTDNPSLDIPQEVIDASTTLYYKVTIDSVSGPEIELSLEWKFTNGTILKNQSSVNIEIPGTGTSFWAIVSANLTAGELIHPHFGPDLSVFNETVNWIYTNYTRQTNRLELKYVEQNNVTQATRQVDSDTYFDKFTGMLVQLNYETNYQNPTFRTTLTWKLVGQNVWDSTSPGSFAIEQFFSLPVIIAIVVVIAVLGVILAAWAVANQRKKARQKAILRKK
jgi:hypothetical protein